MNLVSVSTLNVGELCGNTSWLGVLAAENTHRYYTYVFSEKALHTVAQKLGIGECILLRGRLKSLFEQAPNELYVVFTLVERRKQLQAGAFAGFGLPVPLMRTKYATPVSVIGTVQYYNQEIYQDLLVFFNYVEIWCAVERGFHTGLC
jgi:hypothetical protein